MWDSPRLLNGMANALFALALLLALLIVVRAEVESPTFALKTIRVEGELLHVSRAEVIQVLEGRLRGTFFTVDIEGAPCLARHDRGARRGASADRALEPRQQRPGPAAECLWRCLSRPYRCTAVAHVRARGHRA